MANNNHIQKRRRGIRVWSACICGWRTDHSILLPRPCIINFAKAQGLQRIWSNTERIFN